MGSCTRPPEQQGESQPVVLLADDEGDIRQVLGAALRSRGFQVVECTNGVEALNYLAASCSDYPSLSPPDVIISDIRMPGYTGFDLVAGLCEYARAAPVILITGYGDTDTHQEAKRLGAAMLLEKPIEVEKLCATVGGMLRH